ncbi:MAG: hypothetical protein ACT6Q8_04270 [Niveispirillum sp.]|uniref:hypothetical protein n=1 Tax=Niveispirillum sp. TaxID=1917217 RepID=UPI0012E0CFF2
MICRLRSLLLALPFLLALPAMADKPLPDDPVLIVGALHHLHEREPAFGYDRLRASIFAFKPDVLVLEVRPDELAERKATPGRPEYPAVIWPLLSELRIDAVAMEPGGELFKEIAGAAGAAFDVLKARDPQAAVALSRLDDAMEDVLLAYWQTPGQAQDEQTAAVAAGAQAAQFALAGPAFAAAQARWDSHMGGQVIRTVRSHPGKRVMVIASYKNRAVLERMVRQAVKGRVVDTAPWFAKTAN